MANSELKGNKFKIPKQHLQNLYKNLKNYKGDKHVVGYTRLKNLIQSGSISYENLKNVKHILQNNKDNPTIYNLNGGKKFETWIDNTLKTARNNKEGFKKAKKEAGLDNAYKKTHYKNHSNNLKSRIPKISKSTSFNDIANDNMNYESKQITKIIISETLYKKINKNGIKG